MARTSQNRSPAVMQQRSEPDDSLDFFPTPPWGTRALCEYLARQWNLENQTVWEPACGEGDMAQPLEEFFKAVIASDVFDYGFGMVFDFLLTQMLKPEFLNEQPDGMVDWVISNPPFRLAEDFVKEALEHVRVGVAMLVRSAFLESIDRHEDLFMKYRPYVILQFSERLPMVKGRLDKKASTATAYSWIVWTKRGLSEGSNSRCELEWIPPCRRTLERPDDYPAHPDDAPPPMPLFEKEAD